MEQQTNNLTIDNGGEQETITIKFKGFWGRLFCNHQMVEHGELTILGDNESIPCNKYWRFICTKCGKITKHKQF